MLPPGIRLLAATAVTGLVATSIGAQAADLRGEHFALIDPAAFQYASPAKPQPAPQGGLAGITKKKVAKPVKPKILTDLQVYRTPAQRALDRVRRSGRPCQPAGIVCPVAVFHDDVANSQSWQHATLPSRSEAETGPAIPGMATNGEPALVRPFTDVPGFVPGRESVYRFTVNVPMGRDEHVQLQANLRRNAYNTNDSSDSTLRADWSLRF